MLISCVLYTVSLGCTEGNIRLVNGGTSDTGIEGRVEVCANRTWSTVLGSNWGDEEAMVVCRELGYSDKGAVFDCVDTCLLQKPNYFKQLSKYK